MANRDAEAIELFAKGLEDDAEDLRALMGMTYAYGLRLDADRSWTAFKRALEVADDPHPYLYASVLSRRFQEALFRPASGLEDILKGVTENPDASGILQAMAFEILGSIEERRGAIDAANGWYDQIGAITTWRVVGPFDNISASGHDRIFPPEREDDPDAVYEGLNGGETFWFTPPQFRHDRWIDFARLFPTVRGVFYAVTYINSPSQQRVQLRLGTSGAYKLFLNGTVVSETIDENNNDLDTYLTEVTLAKGWNKVMVKCSNSELTRCNFLLRITNASGQPHTDLTYGTRPQPVPSVRPDARPIENPHLLALRAQWDNEPTELEHALLLIEAHLRNDQVNEAEEIVAEALKLAPDCIATLMQAIETYQRGERNDDVVSTIERIVALRPDLPIALVYAFQQARSSERFDDAEALVDDVKRVLPGSTDYYDLAITIARDRQRYADVLQLQIEAFETHPDNVSYAASAALAAVRRTGSHDAALDVVDRHLRAAYTDQGLLLKANILADAVRYAEWERVYDDLFRLAPAAPGYHLRMASTYAARNDYGKALASTNAAIADAPYVSDLWHNAGTYHRALDDDSAATACFAKALRLDPANFDARESLREMEGRPSPFTLMTQPDIDALMATAPTTETFPEAEAVIIVDDQRRVVYDGSRSETEYEQLIRVLTTNGIDEFKEYYLPGGGSGSLTVDKAVVRKSNGTEIPADRSGSYAVFKSIEPGDFIYIKTRSREFATGRLAPYFVDTYTFNDDIPVQHARYQLLVPKGVPFQYVVSNAVVEMQVQENDYGDLYLWEMDDLKPIVYEESMPSYSEVSISLQISSIPNWKEVISWYYDIARTKTRSSMQIRNLMDSLVPPSSELTQLEIVKEVYRYITNDIRYSNVPFRQSNVVPQKARDVLATRIGDCKDVATLCIAMLAERDIEAYHVLVQTNSYASYRQLLPSIPFDHAIVMVNMDGEPLYIDLTADNVPVGSVPFADIDAFSLAIAPSYSIPERIGRGLFTPNNVDVATTIELHDDLSATVTQAYTHTGARTQFYRNAWKGATAKELERALTEGLSSDFPDVTLTEYTVTNLDTLVNTVSYSLTYTVPNYVMEAAELYIVKAPWYSPYEPDPALSYPTRSYPIVYRNYIDTLTETVSISMPEGYEAWGLKDQEVHDHPVSGVQRTAEVADGQLVMTRRSVNRREVIKPGDYTSYKQFYNDVLRADRQAVVLAPEGTIVDKPSRSGTPGGR